MDGAIKSFLENPSVESAQLIVGMANSIRENTAPLPCSGGCCSEVPPDGGDMESEPGATAWHGDGLAEEGTVGAGGIQDSVLTYDGETWVYTLNYDATEGDREAAIGAALRDAKGSLAKAETELAMLHERAAAKATAAGGEEMPFYGYEEFPHDYADDGMNDDGEEIHDSDEEMYDSDADNAAAGHSEVVPMSGVDTEMGECRLSNIHGYKQLYLPMSNYGHVMGEGVLPSGVGCAWLPSEEERNTEWTQCACVRAGKIQLVVANTPDELCQEHCSGEWCPCPGMQKKWIYRHFTTLDVTHFENRASKELVDMWQIARSLADPDGWVVYDSLDNFGFAMQPPQHQAFYKLRDVWEILTPSDIPEKSSWCFQLKPQFR